MTSRDTYCERCLRERGRAVHHRTPGNCPCLKRGRSYYSPMSGKRLARYFEHRIIPWWVRWLFGWR